MAHEGKVSLELAGLENVYEVSDSISGRVTPTDLETPRSQIQVYDPDGCGGAACRPVYNRTFRVRFDDKRDEQRKGDQSDDDRSSRPIQFGLDRLLTVSAYTVQATLTVGSEGKGRNGGDRDDGRERNRDCAAGRWRVASRSSLPA